MTEERKKDGEVIEFGSFSKKKTRPKRGYSHKDLVLTEEEIIKKKVTTAIQQKMKEAQDLIIKKKGEA